MRLHANAVTCPNSRKLLVGRVLAGVATRNVADDFGVAEKTVRKWVRRFQHEGEAGLLDRSSAPRRRPGRTAPEREAAIAALRRLRMTASDIAEVLDMPLSTVSAVLQRIGLGKRSRLDPPEPPNRYARRHPGELVHVDVKKLGRIPAGRAGHRVHGNRRLQPSRRRRGKRTVGWEYVHVCVDDATRLAYVEVLDDERGATAAGFLRRAVAWFAHHNVRVERVMSDNGAGYRSAAHAAACRELKLRHLFTRPYRPRTNGKAERFIQTLVNEWAYGRIYGSSTERAADLPRWLDRYNWRRPHGALSHQAPGTRLRETNLARNYI